MAAKKETGNGIVRPATPEKDLGIKAPYMNGWTKQELDTNPDNMGMPLKED